MTTVNDDIQTAERIILLLGILDPKAVRAEVAFLTGSRLRSKDLSGVNRRSADPGLPLPDHVDRWTHRQYKAYNQELELAHKKLAEVANILDQAANRQAALLVRLHDEDGNPTEEALLLAAEDASPQADTCANCARVVERTAADKLLGGRCRNCHEYLKRHETERPRDLWADA